MNKAYFILSTGRCGTQWIANYLKENCSDIFCVEHEPLDNEYNPRKMVNFPNEAEISEKVKAHLEGIKKILKTKNYIECGHPVWSTIPYLIKELNENIAIIHLVRHPVPTAYSWLTHQAYCQPILSYLQEKVLLSPQNEGVIFSKYKTFWKDMNPFEKSLYYWLEVNAFALQLEKVQTVPWLRLKFEDLFYSNGLAKLLDFLMVKSLPKLQQNSVIDKFHYITDAWYDWRSVFNHPDVVKIANQLGYNCEEIDNEAYQERYLYNKQ